MAGRKPVTGDRRGGGMAGVEGLESLQGCSQGLQSKQALTAEELRSRKRKQGLPPRPASVSGSQVGLKSRAEIVPCL